VLFRFGGPGPGRQAVRYGDHQHGHERCTSRPPTPDPYQPRL